MVPGSQTPVPRGPQHYQAFVSKPNKFPGKILLPWSPTQKSASLGLSHFFKCQNQEHWRAAKGASTRLVPHLCQHDKTACMVRASRPAPESWGGALAHSFPFSRDNYLSNLSHLLPRIDLGRSRKGLITSKAHLPHTSCRQPGLASCSAPAPTGTGETRQENNFPETHRQHNA